ncbi:MAG: DNA methyltransferase [Anaerolineae bacterium]
MASGAPSAHEQPRVEVLLAQHRRPLPPALVREWVSAWSTSGDLVLDPFCQDLTVARAALNAGRRAVAVTGNPILGLLLRVEAQPPEPDALRGAYERLALTLKGDQPLGPSLDALYDVVCSRCGAATPSDTFTWEQGASSPALADYACAACGHRAREAPVQPAPPAPIDPLGFHRRLVAERLRTAGGHERLIQRLLALYTPRNLYALTVIQLKLELLYADSPLLDPLRACLLDAMEQASALHIPAESGWRPAHTLGVPRTYREANAWRAFGRAIEGMASRGRSGALPLAPDLEPALAAPRALALGTDGLGRLTSPLRGRVALAIATLPRFDPTFAALSWLWSGWLWGGAGARAAAHLLRQRAPEEARYLCALHSALAVLGGMLASSGRLAFCFQAPGTRYLEALAAAAGLARLPLLSSQHDMLDDRPSEPFQVRLARHHLSFGAPTSRNGTEKDRRPEARELARVAVARTLKERGEPAPFTALHGPIWDAFLAEGLLTGSSSIAEADERRRFLARSAQQGLEAAAVWMPLREGGAGVWSMAIDRCRSIAASPLLPDRPTGQLPLFCGDRDPAEPAHGGASGVDLTPS